MLTVIEEVKNKKIGGRIFKCRCECGNIKNIRLLVLRRNNTVSCGCYRAKLKYKHGMWESREYSTWENMIQRCTNPKAKKYSIYGGRGIRVCDRWLESFENFYRDMGPRPKNTTLDRINSDDGYYKENCRWSTPREQFINVSRFTQKIKYNGIVVNVEDLLKDLKIDREVFKKRLRRGFSIKQAIFLNVDIVVLDINNKHQTIISLDDFVIKNKFNKDIIVNLLDTEHLEPYSGYIVRYLIDFKKWPDILK